VKQNIGRVGGTGFGGFSGKIDVSAAEVANEFVEGVVQSKQGNKSDR